jgi:hypothetical protein
MNYSFFLDPRFNLENNNSFIVKIKELFVVYLKMMVILMLVSFLINFFNLIIYEITKFSFFNAIKELQRANFKRLPIFFVLFLGPFLEEVIFRLPLKLKKINVILSLSVMSFYFIGDRMVDLNMYSFYSWIKIVPVVFVVIFTYFFIKKSLLELINEKYYKIFFGLITIFFGLIHIVNFYKIVPSNLVCFVPIFVLPQMALSFFLAYIRLKNGFMWGVFLHCLYNLPITLIYLLNK